MKDSIANTLANAPSVRSADTRSGISGMKWYDDLVREVVERRSQLRSPRARRPAAHRAAARRANGGVEVPGREQVHAVAARRGACMCEWLQSSCFQSTMVPASSRPAASFTTIAEPNGYHANSSSRVHCRSTGRPHGAGEQRRVERDVVGAVVAVAARAVAVDDDDVLVLHAEDARDLAAQRERALAVRPHGELAAVERRDGARRPDRRVREVRPRVRRLEPLDRGRAAPSASRSPSSSRPSSAATARGSRPARASTRLPPSAQRGAATSSAFTACSSRSAQIPTKLPFTTTATTPGAARTASASKPASRAE